PHPASLLFPYTALFRSRHRVLLLPEFRHPERVDDVLGGDVELHVLALRDAQDAVRLAVRVLELPRELLRDYVDLDRVRTGAAVLDRKSTRLNSSHGSIS